jgi:serine/threonine-protein kinase
VFDVGEDHGTLYLAMEYVPGGSLAQRLVDGPPLPVEEKIRIVAEVAHALGHAHERGVLHRDVKPANILLTPSLAAKVTDFGIGKLLTGDTDLTSTGQMVGSPAYMSPEQIRGEKLDVRSDIFSLGVVLYQVLTGRKPFPAETLTTLVYQVLNEEPEDPTVYAPDVPPELVPVIRRCLAKKRDSRYTDAAELAAELGDLVGFSPVMASSALSESKVGRARRLMSASGSTPKPNLPDSGETRSNSAEGEVAATRGASEATTERMERMDPAGATRNTTAGVSAASFGAAAAPPPGAASSKKPLLAGVALLVAAVAVGIVVMNRNAPPPVDPQPTPVPQPTAVPQPTECRRPRPKPPSFRWPRPASFRRAPTEPATARPRPRNVPEAATPTVVVAVPVPPTATPATTSLRVTLTTPIQKGLLLVAAGGKQVLRKEVDFGKGSSGGTMDTVITLPSGEAEINVTFSRTDKTAAASGGSVRAALSGGERRLTVTVDEEGKLRIGLD